MEDAGWHLVPNFSLFSEINNYGRLYSNLLHALPVVDNDIQFQYLIHKWNSLHLIHKKIVIAKAKIVCFLSVLNQLNFALSIHVTCRLWVLIIHTAL